MTGKRPPSPKPANGKWRLARDGVLVATGIFMLVYSTFSAHPQPLIVGAALALMVGPAALRIDDYLRR